MRKLLPILAAPLLVSASPPPIASDPGTGVLCMAVFVYFAEEQGQRCHPGGDPDYQQRLSGYSDRFDSYLIRNMDGGAQTLDSFKIDQGIGVRSESDICEVDFHDDIYGALQRVNAAEMDQAIDEMLADDGTPTFGDCV